MRRKVARCYFRDRLARGAGSEKGFVELVEVSDDWCLFLDDTEGELERPLEPEVEDVDGGEGAFLRRRNSSAIKVARSGCMPVRESKDQCQ